MKKGYKDSPLGAIPIDWEVVKLGEVVNNYDNKRIPLKSEDRNKRKGNYPYYGAQGIIDYIDDYIFEGQYLLIAEDGENVKSRKNDIAVLANGKFWVNNHAHVINNMKTSSLIFLKYFINQMDIKPFVTGLAQPKLNKDSLNKLMIPLPPLTEQKRIAEVLTTVDNKIDNIGKQIDQFTELKKGLMQQLLTKGIDHTEFKDSPLGSIPKDWEVVKLGEVAEVCTGNKDTQNKKEDGKYPFYVRSNKIEKIDSFSFDGEAVLTCGDGAVGKIFHYVNGKFDYHQRVYNIHSFIDNLIGKYFYYYFSFKFYSRVKRLSAKNTVDSVRRSMITDMPILLPALAEQQKIAEILGSVDRKIDILESKREKVVDQKKGLMQKLLTGEKRLPYKE